MSRPGPLLGRGRDAEIFDLGGGRVLRRAMDGRSLAAEAAVMERAYTAGVPVPAVHDVTAEGAIVMDRVSGRPLGEGLFTGAVTVDGAMRIVVELHDLVHAVVAPEDLRIGPVPGDRLLHLDLHVVNILTTADGPVLIDWSTARAGPAAADLAMTWILHASASAADAGADVGPEFDRLRREMSESLLSRVDVAAIAAVLPEVAAWRCADPNVGTAEAERVQALAAAFPVLP